MRHSINVTNSHFFSEHLRRAPASSVNSIISYSDDVIFNHLDLYSNEVSASLDKTGVPGRQVVSARNVNQERWDGENIYDGRYGPLRIIRLADVVT